MRNRALLTMRALAVCACMTFLVVALARVAKGTNFDAVYSPQGKAQDGKEKPAPKVAAAELQAAKAVESAADNTAMMAAAGEFLQKYPKSALRPQVAQLVADRIGTGTDPAAQKITQAESYLKLFNGAGEADQINQVLIDAYASANRLDDAFTLAAGALEKSPNPVGGMINLTLIGLEEAKKQNPKYVAQSKQYGAKAIELIEADKKPATLDAAVWGEYKTKWLPQLYQSLAVLALVSGDNADAKAKIDKAAALNSPDPFTYVIIGSMANGEYQRLAQEHRAATGAAKDELLKKAQAQLDQVIDAYAHALALADGNAQYDQLRAQLKPDLESYYKYRHKDTTEGLQVLIDKYKKR